MLKYLLEIKNRVLLLFITWISLMLISYLYKEILLFLFIESEIFGTNEFKVYYFIFTDVIEVFSVYMKLIFFISFQITFIYFIYHIFTFLSYGLSFLEYSYSKHFFIVIFALWLFSVIISKYILVPAMWNFFINFQNIGYLNLHFEAKLSEYLDFYIKFYYISVFYCQFFTFLFFIFSYINVDSLLIKKFRKLFYFILVFFSTLISPPEVFSQICISVILIICYELFVIGFFFKFYINLINKEAN